MSTSHKNQYKGLADLEVWLKGIAAAAISGGANGIVTGFAAIGIDPNHFNLQEGFHHTLTIGGVSAAISAILGVALYLRQSPLPHEGLDLDSRSEEPRLPR